MDLYIFGKSTNIGEGYTNLYKKKKTTNKLYNCSRQKNSEIYVDLEKKIYFDLKKNCIKKLTHFGLLFKFQRSQKLNDSILNRTDLSTLI